MPCAKAAGSLIGSRLQVSQQLLQQAQPLRPRKGCHLLSHRSSLTDGNPAMYWWDVGVSLQSGVDALKLNAAWGVQAGKLPLAFSARCFTARHHRLQKDACDFRCRDDADGLALASGEGQAFLVLNGIQTQSASLQALLAEGPALREAGVASVRLSPCSGAFARVTELFDAVYNRGTSAVEARAEMATLGLPGALVNGYAHRKPGIEAVAA